MMFQVPELQGRSVSAENMPQQNNDLRNLCDGAALAAGRDKARVEIDYQNLSHFRAASCRRRLGAEFLCKKCDVAAKA